MRDSNDRYITVPISEDGTTCRMPSRFADLLKSLAQERGTTVKALVDKLYESAAKKSKEE